MTHAEDKARQALAQGALAEEMGWPVTWQEVKNLHQVIRDLLDERLTIQAEAWQNSARAHRAGIATTGWHEWPKNPYTKEEHQ